MGLTYSCMDVISRMMEPSVIKEEYPDGRIVTTRQYNPIVSSIGCISLTIVLLAVLSPNNVFKKQI